MCRAVLTLQFVALSGAFGAGAPGKVTLFYPLSGQVVQRDARNGAWVLISGKVTGNADTIYAGTTVLSGFPGSPVSPTIVATGNHTDGNFTGLLRLPAGGWYTLSVAAAFKGAVGDGATTTMGVGEVFVTAGQSNSTDWGYPRQSSSSFMVVSYNGVNWQWAEDVIQEPGVQDLPAFAFASGAAGGSPWVVLGDALAEQLSVPIGFVMCGWGGTKLSQWQPGATDQPSYYLWDPKVGFPLSPGWLYSRLSNIIKRFGPGGIRAVLWHQGESDAGAATSFDTYKKQLERLIASTRADAGWNVPWGVAVASYFGDAPYAKCADQSCIHKLNQQRLAVMNAQITVANEPNNFVGSNTDPYTGAKWRLMPDDIHFNDAGLKNHAELWRKVLTHSFFK